MADAGNNSAWHLLIGFITPCFTCGTQFMFPPQTPQCSPIGIVTLYNIVELVE